MMSALHDLFDRWVGNGRRLTAEEFAKEAEVSARAVFRWVNQGSVPELDAIRNMLASVALPIDFRRELAAFLTRRCVDMKVVFDESPVRGAPDPHPLRITFDADAALCDLQRSIDRAVSELGEGGSEITEPEHAEIARRLGECRRLLDGLERSVGAKVRRTRTA